MRWSPSTEYGGTKRKRCFLWLPLELANESGVITTRWLEMATVEYAKHWDYWFPTRFIDGVPE